MNIHTYTRRTGGVGAIWTVHSPSSYHAPPRRSRSEPASLKQNAKTVNDLVERVNAPMMSRGDGRRRCVDWRKYNDERCTERRCEKERCTEIRCEKEWSADRPSAALQASRQVMYGETMREGAMHGETVREGVVCGETVCSAASITTSDVRRDGAITSDTWKDG